MKLYLSSYRIPTPMDLFDLLRTAPDQVKVALIPNAKDYLADRAWNFKTNEAIEYFKKLGFGQVDVVDLRKYKQTSILESKLADYDLVWANGGNTFCLLYEMKRIGFGPIMKKLLDNGVVFGGESAGALVAGTTIKGSEAADEPGFSEEVHWDALKLTNHILIPHVDNKMFEESLKPMIDMYKDKDDNTVVLLKDNQALVINGGEERISTAT